MKKSKEMMGEDIRYAIELLAKEGFRFTKHNNDLHFVIDDTYYGHVDFWPTTGTWYVPATKTKGNGLQFLFDYCLRG